MLGRAAAFSACAQVASAFLIPANVVDIPAHADSLSILEASARHQLVTLPCSDCLFSSKHGQIAEIEESDEPLFFIQGGANSIAVNFTISHDGQRLEVNGETVYPMGLQIEDILRSPKNYVHQVSTSASVKDIESGDAKTTPVEVTGHGVAVMGETAVSDAGEALVPITYSIFELESQPVTLDELSVHLLKQASGELAILHIEVVARPRQQFDAIFAIPSQFEDPSPLFGDEVEMTPPHRVGHHHTVSHKDCQMLPAALCKMKHAMEAKVKGMRKGGCHGKKGKHGQRPAHSRPHSMHAEHDGPAHGQHHGRPHHMRPHSQQHHHHHHHHGHSARFMHAFSRGLAAVMIPTMAGVAVGMIVSLFGLLTGRLIGFLWIKLYRGGRRGYASIALDEDAAERSETEKEAVQGKGKTIEEFSHAEIEVLPVYEEAPTYEEAVKEHK